MARKVVALDKSVAAPRGPKAVWLPEPPKAPARSAARPLCNSTTSTSSRQTRMWKVVKTGWYQVPR